MTVVTERDIELLGSMPPYYGDKAYTNTRRVYARE